MGDLLDIIRNVGFRDWSLPRSVNWRSQEAMQQRPTKRSVSSSAAQLLVSIVHRRLQHFPPIASPKKKRKKMKRCKQPPFLCCHRLLNRHTKQAYSPNVFESFPSMRMNWSIHLIWIRGDRICSFSITWNWDRLVEIDWRAIAGRQNRLNGQLGRSLLRLSTGQGRLYHSIPECTNTNRDDEDKVGVNWKTWAALEVFWDRLS